MVIPYRAKNPPEHFPFFTILLIVINTAVFALTSDNFLSIREQSVLDFAVSHNTFNLMRMFTAMFLHVNLLHLAGNMLFLWIFGAAVEGRLRPPLYLLVYMLAGLAGDLLSDMINGISNPEQFSLGASGAIMGIAGAYLYMFPYSTICVLQRTFFIGGWITVREWQARWVVLLYIGLDILEAALFHGADGVGHFAHIGGFGVGLLFCLLLRARRDSEDVSNVQAMHAELKDYSMLSLRELDTLMQRPTEDMQLVVAYCHKAITDSRGARADACLETVRNYIGLLIQRADPEQLAWILLNIPVQFGGVPSVYYLRLGSQLEARTSNDSAAKLYRRVYDLYPDAPDTEAALFRLGRILETVFLNRQQALAAYTEMLRRFPNGEMAYDARRSLQQLRH